MEKKERGERRRRYTKKIAIGHMYFLAGNFEKAPKSSHPCYKSALSARWG